MNNKTSTATLKTHHATISKDGAKISYYTLGSGSTSIIVIPGALSVSEDYADFATFLAEDFKVTVIEHRGHGSSSPQGKYYSIKKECEDIAAVQNQVQASYLVGHSFGGLVALEVARRNDTIKKVAVYEPGVSINNSVPIHWAQSYEQKLQQNKPLEAFIIFIKAMHPQSRRTPNWLLKFLLPRIIGRENINQKYNQLHSNLMQHKEVARLNNTYPNYAEISAQTLLMYGEKSGLQTKQMTTLLAKTLKAATIKEFEKLDHFGLMKRAPDKVALAVRDFFHS